MREKKAAAGARHGPWRALSFRRRSGEPARHGFDAGEGRNGLARLAAQALDVRVHGAVGHVLVVGKALGQELLAGAHHFSWQGPAPAAFL